MKQSKLVNGLLIICLIFNITLGFSTFTLYNTISSQKQLIENQSSKISELTGELKLIRAEIATGDSLLETNLTALNSEISVLQSENDARYITLEEKVKLNQTDIDAEIARLATLESEQNALSGKIDRVTPGLAAANIYSQVRNGVVQISDGEYVYGSGFLYDDVGHVVTAFHVVENIPEITVIMSDGTFSKASVIYKAIRSEVAILQLEKPTALPPINMAEANGLAIGDYVLAIGSPFAFNDTLTVGVTSQLHRYENIGGSSTGPKQRYVADLIQFDAAINPGNSGGPLFDTDGKVVGMVVARIAPQFGDGIGLAVSAARIMNALSDYIRSGKVMYAEMSIRVSPVPFDPDKAFALGLETTSGVLVMEVFEDRSSFKAGMRPGDIITKVDDVIIKNPSDLCSLLSWLPGVNNTIHSKTVNVTVIRGKTTIVYSIGLDYIEDDFYIGPYINSKGEWTVLV